MSIKKRLFIGAAVVLAIMFVSGVSILAAGNAGTQSDPLVTLSYLTDKFKPQIISELNGDIEKAAEDMTKELDAKVSGFKSELESGSAGTSTGSGGKSDSFAVVTLSKGKTLTCSVGTEIMLRIGTAEGTGGAPALVDSTTGTTIASGAALAANHMYLVTIEGNGLKATADTVKILVRGDYSLG